MGMNYYAVKKKPSISRTLHIGKSSAGWRFLFHEIDEYELQIRTYNQWATWLKEHIGKDYVLLNEEDEEITLKEFFELVEKKQSIDNPDNFSNAKNIDGYRFTKGDFS